MTKTNIILIIITTLIVVLLTSYLTWFWIKNTEKENVISNNNQNNIEIKNNSNKNTLNEDMNTDYTIYKNSEYNFSLNYPNDWIIDENPGESFGSNSKVIFTSPETNSRNNEFGYVVRTDIIISVFDSKDELSSDGTTGLSIEELAKQDSIDGTYENIVIDNVKGFQYKIGSIDEADTVILLEKNSKIFVINIQTNNSTDQSNTIVQSLKWSK